MNLQERWHSTWIELNLPEPDPQVFLELWECYEEFHRRYHTTQHLYECFSWFDRARHLAEHPAAVQLALWFHDVIYDTPSAENEELSASWAVDVLRTAGAELSLQEAVRSIILATKHSMQPINVDTRLAVDIDLSILGAPSSRFEEYESQIREEYHWVPEVEFRTKRAAILRAFMARPFIYSLHYFQQHLEAQARHNLQRSLEKLNA